MIRLILLIVAVAASSEREKPEELPTCPVLEDQTFNVSAIVHTVPFHEMLTILTSGYFVRDQAGLNEFRDLMNNKPPFEMGEFAIGAWEHTGDGRQRFIRFKRNTTHMISGFYLLGGQRINVIKKYHNGQYRIDCTQVLSHTNHSATLVETFHETRMPANLPRTEIPYSDYKIVWCFNHLTNGSTTIEVRAGRTEMTWWTKIWKIADIDPQMTGIATVFVDQLLERDNGSLDFLEEHGHDVQHVRIIPPSIIPSQRVLFNAKNTIAEKMRKTLRSLSS